MQSNFCAYFHKTLDKRSSNDTPHTFSLHVGAILRDGRYFIQHEVVRMIRLAVSLLKKAQTCIINVFPCQYSQFNWKLIYNMR